MNQVGGSTLKTRAEIASAMTISSQSLSPTRERGWGRIPSLARRAQSGILPKLFLPEPQVPWDLVMGAQVEYYGAGNADRGDEIIRATRIFLTASE